MVPNAHDRNPIPNDANHEIEEKEQEVSQVFEANAVVDPG
jgi:hypothetical protein|tara:strand:- start:198 stop:317 length:120 start_codon:yes stop_codon:yes gene_type:complete